VLPIGIGDNMYTLSLCNGTTLATIAGGRTYAFASGGIGCFDVGGIESSAGLDPRDPEAFVTGLTFTAGGSFTGTMNALPQTSAVPEPPLLSLLGIGLLGVLLPRIRRRRFNTTGREENDGRLG